MDDYWICDCGSDLREGDHRRCWQINAYEWENGRRVDY